MLQRTILVVRFDARMESCLMQAHTVNSSIAVERSSEPFIQRIWPPLGIGVGLGLTAAWTALLGYGLIILIGL